MKSFYWILFLLLVAGNIIVYRELFAPSVLEVSVLDVGKGDAVLVQTPSNKTLLIDTGPDASILRALGSKLPFWQRDIDAVIITSSAAGSAGGLPEVESRYHIATLIRFATTEERISLGDGVNAVVLASPKGLLTMNISYGSTMLTISSSTPVGVYISNGQTIK
jgi:beta-lactamase superfamily II metal-dependent hydrolase